MDSFDYSGVATTASVLFAKFGKDITLRKVSRGTYDPTTGASTDTSTDYTVKGIAKSPLSAPVSMYFFGNAVDTSGVKDYQRIVKIPALGMTVAPESGDQMIFEGRTWQVMAAQPINPGTIGLLYVCLVEA